MTYYSTQDILKCNESNTAFVEDENAFKMENSAITFNGEGNILYIRRGVSIKDTKINFNGNNSIVFLSASENNYLFEASVHSNSTLYIGKDAYFNGKLYVIASEERNVIIGKEALISFGIWIRTADPHLIYDISTKKRINSSKDVNIGDHVWIGQNALLLKGSSIHSGSIIAANSVVSGKKIPSNEIWGGNPSKVIKKGVFWEGACVHSWDSQKTERYKYNRGSSHIYQESQESVSFEDINIILRECKNAEERIEECKRIDDMASKDRFALNRKKGLLKYR